VEASITVDTQPEGPGNYPTLIDLQSCAGFGYFTDQTWRRRILAGRNDPGRHVGRKAGFISSPGEKRLPNHRIDSLFRVPRYAIKLG
jgi:hypothetical protein